MVYIWHQRGDSAHRKQALAFNLNLLPDELDDRKMANPKGQKIPIPKLEDFDSTADELFRGTVRKNYGDDFEALVGMASRDPENLARLLGNPVKPGVTQGDITSIGGFLGYIDEINGIDFDWEDVAELGADVYNRFLEDGSLKDSAKTMLRAVTVAKVRGNLQTITDNLHRRFANGNVEILSKEEHEDAGKLLSRLEGKLTSIGRIGAPSETNTDLITERVQKRLDDEIKSTNKQRKRMKGKAPLPNVTAPSLRAYQNVTSTELGSLKSPKFMSKGLLVEGSVIYFKPEDGSYDKGEGLAKGIIEENDGENLTILVYDTLRTEDYDEDNKEKKLAEDEDFFMQQHGKKKRELKLFPERFSREEYDELSTQIKNGEDYIKELFSKQRKAEGGVRESSYARVTRWTVPVSKIKSGDLNGIRHIRSAQPLSTRPGKPKKGIFKDYRPVEGERGILQKRRWKKDSEFKLSGKELEEADRKIRKDAHEQAFTELGLKGIIDAHKIFDGRIGHIYGNKGSHIEEILPDPLSLTSYEALRDTLTTVFDKNTFSQFAAGLLKLDLGSSEGRYFAKQAYVQTMKEKLASPEVVSAMKLALLSQARSQCKDMMYGATSADHTSESRGLSGLQRLAIAASLLIGVGGAAVGVKGLQKANKAQDDLQAYSVQVEEQMLTKDDVPDLQELGELAMGMDDVANDVAADRRAIADTVEGLQDFDPDNFVPKENFDAVRGQLAQLQSAYDTYVAGQKKKDEKTLADNREMLGQLERLTGTLADLQKKHTSDESSAQEFAALKTQVDSLSDYFKRLAPEEGEDVLARMTNLEQRADTFTTNTKFKQVEDEAKKLLAELKGTIAEYGQTREATLQEAKVGENDTAYAQLSDRLTTIETRLTALGIDGTDKFADNLTGLKNEIERLGREFGEFDQSARDPELQAGYQRLNEIVTGLEELDLTNEESGYSATVARLEGRDERVLGRIEEVDQYHRTHRLREWDAEDIFDPYAIFPPGLEQAFAEVIPADMTYEQIIKDFLPESIRQMEEDDRGTKASTIRYVRGIFKELDTEMRVRNRDMSLVHQRSLVKAELEDDIKEAFGYLPDEAAGPIYAGIANAIRMYQAHKDSKLLKADK